MCTIRVTLCLAFLLHLCNHMLMVHGMEQQQQQQEQQQVQRCPRMCNCSIYMGLNMANCSGENLISANIGMPPLVEHLDLSYNDITTVDNECFKGLRHLQGLLLNRNSISFIELDAFSSLTKLRTINLTCNRLESFDNRIFEQNLHLTIVDLSGNKFMHLPNSPIIRSASLETLDLHKSQLTHLHVNYFGELPNITYIDLSENLLIVLNLAAFATNNQLRSINVQNNRIKCDEQTEMSIIWMNRNRVEVAIDNCPKNGSNHSTPPKFERMSVMPSNVTTSLLGTATTNSTFLDLNTVWNTHSENDHNIPILNERCMANETTVEHACQLFEICVSNLTRLVEEVEEKLQLKSGGGNMRIRYDPVRLHHSWYEFVSIQVAFYGGIMLGTLFGAIMLFTCKLISDCVTMSGTDSDQRTRRKRRNRPFVPSEVRDFNDNIDVTGNENGRNISRELVPMNNRRSGQSTSFFAIFYERPVRHRYYRQINRNATNLVRRLSQSRLFLNSSRVQRRNRQESTNTQAQSEPESDAMLIGPNDIETVDVTQDDAMTDDVAMLQIRGGSIHSLNISRNRNENVTENRLNAMRTVASENDLFRNGERSETPPPPYNAVAHHVP